MIQLGFLIDINKCLGCHSCAIACRQEHQNFQDVEMRKITRVETGEGQFYYLSLACNHCESPECFRVCPQGTYKKRRDGVVLHAAIYISKFQNVLIKNEGTALSCMTPASVQDAVHASGPVLSGRPTFP